MNYPATTKNEAPRSLQFITHTGFSVLGLALILFIYSSAHAQTGPVDSPSTGQSEAGQYKPGKTPAGQEYGTVKKGEPQKKPDSSSEKKETKPSPESIVNRDKRENHKGSGPDPLGRY